MNKNVLCLVVMATAGSWISASAADEFPKRKSGLWEMKTTGGPVGARTIQQCIDEKTDDMLRNQSNEGQNCSKPVVKRSGNRYRVNVACNSEGTRSTMDGDYTMVSDTAYQGDMKMHFTPPMAGVSEMNMKVDGRWLGACKAGMKPGDIVMEGMPNLNMLNLGKGGGMTPEQAKKFAEDMMKNLGKQAK